MWLDEQHPLGICPYFEGLDLIFEGNNAINMHVSKRAQIVDDIPVFYDHCLEWLSEQLGSPNNFKCYRSELNTFLIWCWDLQEISIRDVTRREMSMFMDWCAAPGEEWIATAQHRHFIKIKGESAVAPNAAWRPFVVREGESLGRKVSAIKAQLSILNLFFQYLVDMEVLDRNPVRLLMRQSKYKRMSQPDGTSDMPGKALTPSQWRYVRLTTSRLREEDPERHARTHFLIALLHSTYCRVSEISARAGFAPLMSLFRRTREGYWVFHVPVSKSGKPRDIMVSDVLLDELKCYRLYLGMTPLPAHGDQDPLLVRHVAGKHGRDKGLVNANLGDRQIRDIVTLVYNEAADQMALDGHTLDAAELREMTVHSLRHTGITHDLEAGRPPEHVMKDSGHSSLDMLSVYIQSSMVSRAESSKNKGI